MTFSSLSLCVSLSWVYLPSCMYNYRVLLRWYQLLYSQRLEPPGLRGGHLRSAELFERHGELHCDPYVPAAAASEGHQEHPGAEGHHIGATVLSEIPR